MTRTFRAKLLKKISAKLVLQIAMGFVALVMTHALLSIAHALGWFPENELASLLLSPSSIWAVEWLRWVVISGVTVLLWAVADHWFYRRSPEPQSATALTTAKVSVSKREADIDARQAFFRILEDSQWRADQDEKTDPKGLVYDWRELRLSSDIHKALRNARLAAWGEECLPGTVTTPEKPIPPETWDRVAIHFDRSLAPRTAAHVRGRTSRELGPMAWVGIKFSSDQIAELFPLKSTSSLDRISMIELLEIANESGWNFSDQHSLHLIDLQDAIRQGGVDGHLAVWGRLNRWPNSEQLMRKEILELVPPDHWKEFRVHLFGTLDGDNFKTYSWHVQPSATAERGYVDLHVSRAQATEWLRREASSFKGKTTLQNRA